MVKRRAFTLIELLVALAIVALLLSIVVPRYFGGIARAEESTLRANLAILRDALDKHYADTGRYPDTLEVLVARKYLRSVPEDPLTRARSTWVIVPPEDRTRGGVFDVKSGAPGRASDGKAYAEW